VASSGADARPDVRPRTPGRSPIWNRRVIGCSRNLHDASATRSVNAIAGAAGSST